MHWFWLRNFRLLKGHVFTSWFVETSLASLMKWCSGMSHKKIQGLFSKSRTWGYVLEFNFCCVYSCYLYSMMVTNWYIYCCFFLIVTLIKVMSPFTIDIMKRFGKLSLGGRKIGTIVTLTKVSFATNILSMYLEQLLSLQC